VFVLYGLSVCYKTLKCENEINSPRNKLVFATYLTSGGMNQRKITWGGVAEKRVRTTALLM